MYKRRFSKFGFFCVVISVPILYAWTPNSCPVPIYYRGRIHSNVLPDRICCRADYCQKSYFPMIWRTLPFFSHSLTIYLLSVDSMLHSQRNVSVTQIHRAAYQVNSIIDAMYFWNLCILLKCSCEWRRANVLLRIVKLIPAWKRHSTPAAEKRHNNFVLYLYGIEKWSPTSNGKQMRQACQTHAHAIICFCWSVGVEIARRSIQFEAAEWLIFISILDNINTVWELYYLQCFSNHDENVRD